MDCVCNNCGEDIFDERDACFVEDEYGNPITLCYDCWLEYEYN